MKSSKEGKPFKVIIVGGGVAGLTLANCLQQANINYVLLEARSAIAPQVGASIGIFPNGCRIFDQLGVFDKILPYAIEPDEDLIWLKGKKIKHASAKDLLRARFGYSSAFLERQKLLQVMYDNLDDKSKIIVSQRCSSIDHSEDGVTVKCEDGKEYTGDVVVGSDGVHSFVRSEMRRYADAKTEELMKKDRKSLSAEYLCLFGIAGAVDGIGEGEIHRAYNKGFSFMTIGGVNTTYFFVFEKLAKRYFAPDIPKYSKSDTDKFAASYGDHIVGGTGTTTFREVYEKRKTSCLVSTEEAYNETWTFGRLTCVGDSIHKMTPNSGAGGNASIESAAAIANSLYELVHTNKYEKADYASVSAALQSFHDVRKDRVKHITKESNDFTRIEALNTIKERLMVLFFLPNAGDFLIDAWASTLVGAVKLDYLPKPKKSIGTLMPFNPDRGFGKEESLTKRILWALPLLMLWWVGSTLLGECSTKMGPILETVMTKPWIEDISGRVPVKEVFTGIGSIDGFVKQFVAAFTPSMAGLGHNSTIVQQSTHGINLYAPQRLQALTFLADITPVNAIWLIESCRRGNIMTLTTVPIFFMLYMQLVGIGIVAPVFYFVHYIFNGPSKLHAADNRLVNTSYAKTIVPALIIGYVIPTVGMYWPTSSLSTLQSWNFLWQFFPITLVGLHGILARYIHDTTEVDKYKNVLADLPYLRRAYIFSALVSTGMYWYVYAVTPVPFFDIFFKDLMNPVGEMNTLTEIMGKMLKLDEIFCFLSSAVWTLLCFRDLKNERRLKTGWISIISAMVLSTVIFGPGASFGLMWWWREEILASKRVQEE